MPPWMTFLVFSSALFAAVIDVNEDIVVAYLKGPWISNGFYILLVGGRCGGSIDYQDTEKVRPWSF